MADFFWFSDEQWARIEPLLPQDTRGMPRVDDRRVLSGIVPALKSGGRWGDCPEQVYGPKKTLYNRFRRWAERGVWERIFAQLAGVEGVRQGKVIELDLAESDPDLARSQVTAMCEKLLANTVIESFRVEIE